MEIKTCEDYVLARLRMFEENSEKVQDDLNRLSNAVQSLDSENRFLKSLFIQHLNFSNGTFEQFKPDDPSYRSLLTIIQRELERLYPKTEQEDKSEDTSKEDFTGEVTE